MHIIYRAEVDKAAHLPLHKVSIATESAIEAAIKHSLLDSLDMKIRYIPIVMHDDDRKKYRARSGAEFKKKIYNCCPQLNIEPFLTGTVREQLVEYIGGLRECRSVLSRFGATEEQVVAFAHMLDDTIENLTI